jgi:hypothetical protein
MNSSFATELLTLSALSAEFGYLVDHGRATECANLFAPDAKLIFGEGSPKPGTLDGLQAIRAFLSARQAQTGVITRHLATNFRLEWNGGPEATLESLLTVFRSEDATREPVVSVIADVQEIFTRHQGDTWRIQERLTKPVFVHRVP